MVANSLNLLVNQDIEAMSLRSQRGRVTFSEEIEMDSLEPELSHVVMKERVLGTIKEYEFNGQKIEDEFDDENLNEFVEFDVSWERWKRYVCDDDWSKRRRYALKAQTNCLTMCSYEFVLIL